MAVSVNDSDFIDFSSDLGRESPKITDQGNEGMLPAIADEELKLVLVGKIGVGKSSTGNLILGRDAFKSKRSATSVTTHSDWQRSKVNDKSVVVVDTPGLYDNKSENSRKRVQDEIKTCMELAAPGIHAIIFVLSAASRFSNEDKKCFEDFFEIFGEDFFKYAVVVFTHADLLNYSNMNIQDYIEDDETLLAFLEKCGNRKVAFNNKDPCPNEKEIQRNHLISIVIEMNQSLKTYYTNEDFANSELRLNKLEEDKLNKLREKLNAKHAADKQTLVKQFNKEKQELRDEIRKLVCEGERKKEKNDQNDRCILI